MKIFMTGVTGFIGRELAAALVARGDRVIGLSRRAGAMGPGGVELVTGDPAIAGAWMQRLRGCDAIVHLAGESIGAQRWNAAVKWKLRESRVAGTRNVVAAIAASDPAERPKILVSASGAGIYPFDDSERAYVEGSARGDTFLADLCAAWEAEAERATAHGVRVATMRTGVVLGRGGEALGKLLLPFKLFVGGPVGNGQQWFSWVHLEDAVGGYLYTIDHDALRGPVNLVAPGVVRNRELARAIGHALHRPSLVPVPAFAIRAAVGELGAYLLHGRCVVPSALLAAGYPFRLGDLPTALTATI
jgi:uncharacterized protein (TIGR01777 family)